MEVRPELWTYYKRKSDGKVAVRIRVNIGQDWKHVPDRAWYIEATEWNEEFGMVNPKVKGAGNINAAINATVMAVQNYYRQHPDSSLELLLAAPAKVSAELAREKEEEAVAELSFWEWIDDFLLRAHAGKLIVRKKGKRKGQPLAGNTVRSYEGTIANLRLFHSRRLPIEWHTIDKTLYEELLHFLRFELKTNESRVKKKKSKYSDAFLRPRRDNSVGKDVKNFRALLGWAMEDLDSKEYEGKFPEVTAHTKSWFMVPEEDISKYVPEPDERDAVFDLVLSDRPELLRHQDRAIMSYYFVQRFGDSMDIDESNFYSSNSTHYLRYTSEKTSTPVEIPIKPRLWEIIKRNNHRMPPMTNQEANRALKELGQLAGLNGWHVEYVTIEGKVQKIKKRKWEMLTTHTFRRLGATDMDEAGVMPQIIMALGGWATEEQMRAYIAKGGRRARRQAHVAAQHEFFK